jgi:protein-arginine kinase
MTAFEAGQKAAPVPAFNVTYREVTREYLCHRILQNARRLSEDEAAGNVSEVELGIMILISDLKALEAMQ